MKKVYLIAGALLLSVASVFRCGSDDTTIQTTDSGADDAAPIVLDGGQEGSKPIYEAGPWDGNFDYWPAGKGPLFYKGGKVLIQPINVYLVWYGKWDSASVSLIENLVASYSSSTYYRTLYNFYQIGDGVPSDGGAEAGKKLHSKTNHHSTSLSKASTDGGIPNGGKVYVSQVVQFGRSFFDPNYSQGTDLFESDVQTIVQNQISSNNLQPDPNGVYVLVASENVQGSGPDGYCGSWCGYHNDIQVGNGTLKYAYIENANECLTNCSVQDAYLDAGFDHSPNNNWGLDAMVSVLIHELNEVITDPEGSAWLASDGSETMDNCAWNYQSLYITNNQSVANVRIGDKDYLVQTSWTLFPDGGQGCSLHP